MVILVLPFALFLQVGLTTMAISQFSSPMVEKVTPGIFWTVGTLILNVLATLVFFGLAYRHTNPDEWNLLISPWAGLQCWILWGIGGVFRAIAEYRFGSRFLFISSSFFLTPPLFGYIECAYIDYLKQYFEYYT
jgi:hypothetical protein